MPYDLHCNLWPNRDEAFFRDRSIRARKQSGPHCVSTVLAMLSGSEPGAFQGRVNTQDPVSWSFALRESGLKLAYCPTDARKLRFYLPELLAIDDLFTLSFYCPRQPSDVLRDPDERGWVCGSHIVILHRRSILDPASGAGSDANSHPCLDMQTKRIFRVVPAGHERGL
jgi:hypothetical protein